MTSPNPPTRAASTVLIVGLAVAAAAAIAGATPGGAATTAAKPKWQYLPSLSPKKDEYTNTQYAPVGWAADRVWIASHTGGEGLRLASFRLSGTKLTSGVMNAPIETAAAVIAGSDLAYRPPDRNLGGLAAPMTRTLLPSGQLGEPQAVPGGLENAKPKNATIAAGARIGERRVWALHLIAPTGKVSVSVCCTESGASRVITQWGGGTPHTIVRLGVDARQRLWLAWFENRKSGGARLLELDPATLAPKTSKPLAVPRTYGNSTRLELPCAATCRVVVNDPIGGILSWAPGERSPTRISRLVRGQHPELVGAAYRGRSLVAVYKPADASEIQVARGNARGARLRRVASLPVGQRMWPAGRGRAGASAFYASFYNVRPVFTPGGVVVFMRWHGEGRRFRGEERVTGAFVPLGS